MPPALKWSPRVGAAYAFDDETVLRGGYGLYWAPFNYPGSSTSAEQLRPGRLHPEHHPVAEPHQPGLADQPVPERRRLADRQHARRAHQSRQQHRFVDQNRTAPRVQQYSVDVQRELPGSMALTVGYMGARTDHAGIGGSSDTAVNINQLDPPTWRSGAALNDALPNPFLGNPNVPLSLSTPGDAAAVAAAAAVPAVPAGQRLSGHRGLQPLQRRR